jgi:hypothetical protein
MMAGTLIVPDEWRAQGITIQPDESNTILLRPTKQKSLNSLQVQAFVFGCGDRI